MTNVKFLKYPSLRLVHNFDESKVPSKILNSEWYSTEKLHGSNVAIITNGSEYKFSSRSGIMNDNDSLMKVFRRLNLDIYLEAANKILKDYKGLQVTLYGEGYGAGIQKMNYEQNRKNTTNFLIFNAFVEVKTNKYEVLTLIDLLKYFPENMLVPIESRGKLFDIIKKDNLDKKSNFGGDREGYVYQLVHQEMYDDNLPTPNFYGIKYKGEKFLEVSEKAKKVKTQYSLTSDELKLCEDISRYITNSRAQNVLSHGNINTSNKSAAMGLLIKEIWLDIIKEYPTKLDIKSKSLQAIEKELKPEIVKIAKEELGIN